MSNHWGGQLLNEALCLAEERGFFRDHSPEKVRNLLIDLVKMADRKHDCNAYEILDEIGPRYDLCYCCLQAANQFNEDGCCPTCCPESDVDDEIDEEEAGLIKVSMDRWIPYDKLNAEQVSRRADLQDRLRNLEAAPGQLLVARYSGQKHPKSDVENLLFYNIGSECFAGAFRYGVQFEESSQPIARSIYQYYLKNSVEVRWPASWKRATKLAHFDEVKVAAPGQRWAHQIWLDLRSLRLPAESVHSGPFEVVLKLRSPSRVTPKVGPGRLKKLLDGVVAAYQWDSGGRLGAACERLATLTGRTAEQLQQLLADSAGAVLGTPGELLQVYREGVKWNPDDHRCVAGIVEWSPGKGSEWTLSGEIWRLEPFLGAAPLVYLPR